MYRISRNIYFDDAEQIGALLTVVCDGQTYTATAIDQSRIGYGALAEVELPDSALGKTAYITASWDGHSSAQDTETVDDVSSVVDVFIYSATPCTVTVNVSTWDGELVTGAWVYISSVHSGRTTNGAVTLSGIAAGEREIIVRYRIDDYYEYRDTVTITDGATYNIEINEKQHGVDVYVTPNISGVKIELAGDNRYTDFTVNGYASFFVRDGAYTLIATKEDYEIYTQTLDVGEYTEVSIGLDTNTCTVTFTVSDDNGAVSGATIKADGREAVSGTDGKAMMSLPKNGTYTVTAAKAAYLMTVDSVTTTGSDELDKSITLIMVSSEYTLTITVQNGAGTAIAGAVVTYGGERAVTGADGTAVITTRYYGGVIIVTAAGYKTYRSHIDMATTAYTVVLASLPPGELISQIIAPCDIVVVRHPLLNIDVSAKVVEVVYDVLRERVDRIELGAKRAIMYSEPNEEAVKAALRADNAMAVAREALSKIAQGETRTGAYQGNSDAVYNYGYDAQGYGYDGFKYNNAKQDISLLWKPVSVIVVPLYTTRKLYRAYTVSATPSDWSLYKSYTEYHGQFCGEATASNGGINGIVLTVGDTASKLTVSNPRQLWMYSTKYGDDTEYYHKRIDWNCSAGDGTIHSVPGARDEYDKEDTVTTYGYIAFY